MIIWGGVNYCMSIRNVLNKNVLLWNRQTVSPRTSFYFDAHYECRRHDTPAKPRVQWGQSPKWNPGYTRTKSNIELRRSGTIMQAFVLRLGSAAPLGLNRGVPIINPGLAPWAMQEYRPYRAPLPIYFIILMRLSWYIKKRAVTRQMLATALICFFVDAYLDAP